MGGSEVCFGFVTLQKRIHARGLLQAVFLDAGKDKNVILAFREHRHISRQGVSAQEFIVHVHPALGDLLPILAAQGIHFKGFDMKIGRDLFGFIRTSSQQQNRQQPNSRQFHVYLCWFNFSGSTRQFAIPDRTQQPGISLPGH